ncbi:MAG: hypothetical protein ACWGPS_11585 [Candidatus Promineifilaceae bacterium]
MLNRFAFLSLLLVVIISLSGCMLTANGTASESIEEVTTTTVTTSINTPPVQATTVVEQMQPMPVEYVAIEVGVGSPIPVDIVASGTWPELCAQLARVDQKIEGFQIEVSLYTTPAQPNCPPDYVGLPFRIAIPINVVEMSEGDYTVTVNGVQASFSLPLPMPDVEESVPPDLGVEEPQSFAGGLCPDVPRPAVALALPSGHTLITNPLSGESCTVALGEAGEDVVSPSRTAKGDLFYTFGNGEQLQIKRVAQDGSQEVLPFTAVNLEDALLSHDFVVSPDGSRIAWSASSAGPDFSGPPESKMWVASMDGSDVVMPLPPLVTESGGPSRAITPVRFSADNSTLYFAYQPMGLGGAWSSFVGRYDNLYALRLNSEAEPALLYDCQDDFIVLCIGDFYEVENQMANLAYVTDKNVVIINGQGDVVNTLTVNHDYVGFPTFGPGAELIFYGADLDQSPDAQLQPETAAIYRVAPPTAPYEMLLSAPELLLPQSWLDGSHVVISYYHSDGDYWGAAVVGLDGSLQVLESEPYPTFVGVLTEN